MRADYSGCDNEWSCFRCKGSGAVADVQRHWIERGRIMRDARIAAGRSLRQEAERLCIKVVELSEMERGVRCPL